MSSSAHQTNGQLAAALFLALLCVYSLTFSGRLNSGDELRVLDGLTSFFHFGDWLLDETLYLSFPAPIDAPVYPAHELPWDERSAAWFALPLYALAHAVPALGMVHAVLLLNVIAMALAGVSVFWLALGMDYSRGAALAAGLMFGLGTLAWPYSKTLFRDPLLLLSLSAAALCLLYARQRSGMRRVRWAMLALLSLLVASMTKTAWVFALPALFFWAWPKQPSRWAAAPLIGLPLAGLLAVPVLYQTLLQLAMEVFGPSGDRMTYAPEALYAYLISPTASLWATSPVLLLAPLGAVILWQRGDWRTLLTVTWMVSAFALGHALTTAHHWFGGFSYPPRFLVPVIPFAMLLTLPVWELALKRWRLLSVGVFVWSGVSVWVQWTHAASFIHEYSNLLPPESMGVIDWLPALQDVAYSRWYLLPQAWGAIGFDVAWWRAPLHPWTAALGGVGLAAAAMISGLMHGCRLRWRWLLSGMVAWMVAMSGSLVTLNRHDGTTFSASVGAQTAYALLEAQARPGDLLLTPFSSMTSFLLNSNRLSSVRPFTLLIPRLEALPKGTSAEQFDPLDTVHLRLPQVVAHFAARQDRAWFFTNSTPLQPRAPRVDEHYFSTRFYLVREHTIPDVDIRLLEYILEPSPPYGSFQRPEFETSAAFADKIRLLGVTLPRGTDYEPGDALPVLLHWQALQPLERDYTIALFVADAAGNVVAQGGDGPAVGGWMPTRRWPVQHVIYDRRGVFLPQALLAGRYQLWVVLYEFVNSEIVRLPVTDGDAREGTIAVLPVTLWIR